MGVKLNLQLLEFIKQKKTKNTQKKLFSHILCSPLWNSSALHLLLPRCQLPLQCFSVLPILFLPQPLFACVSVFKRPCRCVHTFPMFETYWWQMLLQDDDNRNKETENRFTLVSCMNPQKKKHFIFSMHFFLSSRLWWLCELVKNELPYNFYREKLSKTLVFYCEKCV